MLFYLCIYNFIFWIIQARMISSCYFNTIQAFAHRKLEWNVGAIALQQRNVHLVVVSVHTRKTLGRFLILDPKITISGKWKVICDPSTWSRLSIFVNMLNMQVAKYGENNHGCGKVECAGLVNDDGAHLTYHHPLFTRIMLSTSSEASKSFPPQKSY